MLLNNALDINKKKYNTGNIVINTMLNYYLCMVEEQCKIDVKGLILDDIVIESVDLCIIVSNLIKNAVEATMKLESGDKEIYFTVKQGKEYVYIQVKNTVDIQNAAKYKKGIVTTKSDKKNHGLGLENIKRAVKKYNGNCNIKIENGYFIADVTVEI